MNSGLYAGEVRHRRRRPRPHEFTYGVYHALIDLDELGRLDREVVGFGHNRAALTTFHDRDHLGDAPLPVREKLRRWVARQGAELPAGRVLLHTNLRVLGYVFNPVSWFFCHDPDGRLALVVAEVRNTFGESYCYLLDDLAWTGEHRCTARRAKRFHVSPFMDVPDHEYEFVFRPPAGGGPVAVHMDVRDRDGLLFDATVAGTRSPFTSAQLARHLLRYPLVTLHTIAAIHWQALRLWLKRVPHFRKPAPPDNGLADLADHRPVGSEPLDERDDAPKEHAS